MDVLQALRARVCPQYADFNRTLLPTIDPQRVLGVRVPHIRQLAKTLQPEDAQAFLQVLPHTFLEENHLHAMLLAQIQDWDNLTYQTQRFLPFVDNWQTCDLFTPRLFERDERAESFLLSCLASPHPYTIRFGVQNLLRWFVKSERAHAHAPCIAHIASSEYYVRMAVAWYLSLYTIHHEQKGLALLASGVLTPWVQHKTIQKICESRQASVSLRQKCKALR